MDSDAKTTRGLRCGKWLVSALAGVAFLLPSFVQLYGAQPVVAVHDSELTRALETMPASGATPTGAGTSGRQWWPTNWHYFVMPDSVKETLRSDGTSFAVVSDADIVAGRLVDSNGLPNYPILISLASEATLDAEVAQLTNYVAAGGFLLVGSSAFTRNPDGTTRGDFAFANELGAHSVNPSLANWEVNATFTRVSAHPLVARIPAGVLAWQMPWASDEISWPEANHVPYPPSSLPHLLWKVQVAGATVIAQGDTHPYLLVRQFGKGYFIYNAAMQPLLGHGGWAPGMYAYGVLRNAIQWAFQSANLPLTRLSPWPYPYDAAVIFRHDMEAIPDLINSIEASAQFEAAAGARGDYFFCTGELREEMANNAATIASLRRAISNDNATIGSHSGGLTNPNLHVPALDTNSYDYWHWGPDEVLDIIPPGYASGKAYALASISNSFLDMQGWFAGLNNGGGLKLWVAPYFNSTREASLQIQEELGVNPTADDKLGPFPHWALSTQTPDKRYPFLALPVSDWFVGTQIAQAMEDGHTTNSVHALVDFYYSLGALINLYSHSSSDGNGPAGGVASEYVTYSLAKPRIWSANTMSVYNWWVKRSTVQLVSSFATSVSQSVATLAISGSSDTNTAVEILLPEASFYGIQVFTNGVAAPANIYRTNGQVLKLLVGTAVTNAVIKYSLVPTAQNDAYAGSAGTVLTVGAPGVLVNDTPAAPGGAFTAMLVSGPSYGALNLNVNGGFSYTPATNFAGMDTFTYQAAGGQTNSSPTIVSLMITPREDLFFDNLTRSTGVFSLTPWAQQLGAWSITNGTLMGTSDANSYGSAWYNNLSWTDYWVQAQVRFSTTNAYGGGLGGRLNPATGAHYAAWIYPEGSPAGSKVLKLVKFEGWTTWSSVPMAQVNLPGVGTNRHTVTLAFKGHNITVYFDGIQKINLSDNNFDSVAPFANGGISADLYTSSTGYAMTLENIVVSASGTLPAIQSLTQHNGLTAITWGTIRDYNYRPQYKDTPTSTNWNDLPPDVTGTGPTAAITNATGNLPQRFYRVLLVP